MRLKRLELFGFKSFADRTALEFPHEVTGIVGPNGCGKSNVVDAVRWVLGETRPTSMRGGEMTDVIFKGSSSRPGMGLAEVTLVLDNEGGEIPTHGAEVAVTRRVHKSGEGEYEIDGSRVRLKDVKDLLFDTGLGSRGYSVLEQGRIDAVLSANPQERRAIFEEAAGISRFRQRRKEAESRLRRVDQDTERLDDVLRELETRSRSLKIQAGKAERWVAARDEWRMKGVVLAGHSVERFEAELDECRTSLSDLERELTERAAKREADEAALEERTTEERAMSAALDELAERAASVGGDLRATTERMNQLDERVEAWSRSAADEQQRTAELEQRLAERQGELDEVQSSVERETGALTLAETAVESVEGVLKDSMSRYREARRASEEQTGRVQECLHEKTAAFNEAKHLTASLEPLDARVASAEGRLSEAAEREQAASTEVGAAREALSNANEHRAGVETRATGLEERAAEIARAAQAQFTARGELEVQRAALESRAGLLLDWERERETLGEAALALLEQREELGASLAGMLADHLEVEPRYARALDTALGSASQAVVLADSSQALRVAAWLRDRELGQARLLVAEPLNLGSRSAGTPDLPWKERGSVLGLLAHFVEPGAEVASLVRSLLGDCLLVADLPAALRLATSLPGWRLVTPEGDLVDATGLVTGYAEVTQGAVGRRAEAHELEGRADEVAAEIETRSAELARLEAAEEEVREALMAVRAELRAAAEQASSEQARSHAAGARLEEALRAREEVAAGVESARSERERLAGQLEEVQRTRKDAEQRFEEENAHLVALERARQALESEREESAKDEQRARIEWARLSEVVQSLGRRRRDLASVCAEAEAEMERTLKLSERHKTDAQSGAQERESLGAEAVQLEASHKELQEQLGSKREQELALRDAIAELRGRADGASREVESRMERMSHLRLEEQRLDLSLADVLRRLEEDHKLDREVLMDLHENDPELADIAALAALDKQVAELKRMLDKLGPVNLEAVEELEEVSQRLAYLTEQRKDLGDAKAELIETIETINSESERLFMEAFDEIRGHFRRIFRQLFGGGRADIELAEDMPVLEAGIDISARPPGRETLPIGLLSGGQRTMTALALLFAVFQSRPSPFCVLDEVDAALDDANVGRFLGMLDTFVEGSQFIIVTHNKGTMAACNMLYGITMETKGVSRNVAVELEEVAGFVPEVTGNAQLAAEAREEVRSHEPLEEPEDEPVVELTPVAAGEPADEPAELASGQA